MINKDPVANCKAIRDEEETMMTEDLEFIDTVQSRYKEDYTMMDSPDDEEFQEEQSEQKAPIIEVKGKM
jgi:hypothetical protein